MQYDIFMNDNKIGNGLSNGELNQWLIDLDDELEDIDKETFRKDIGAGTSKDLEEFLYSKAILVPLIARHKENLVTVIEHDF